MWWPTARVRTVLAVVLVVVLPAAVLAAITEVPSPAATKAVPAGIRLRNPTPVVGVGSTQLLVSVDVTRSGGLASRWRLRRVDPPTQVIGIAVVTGEGFAEQANGPVFVTESGGRRGGIGPFVQARTRTAMNVRLPDLQAGRYELDTEGVAGVAVRFGVVAGRPPLQLDAPGIGCDAITVGPVVALEVWWSARGWQPGPARRVGGAPAQLCGSSHRLLRVTTPSGTQYLVT
jgi:hypothetical protein